MRDLSQLNKDKNQVRCDCGRLYLVKTKDGYEFKCPRCKRMHLIKFEEMVVNYLTKEDKGGLGLAADR